MTAGPLAAVVAAALAVAVARPPVVTAQSSPALGVAFRATATTTHLADAAGTETATGLVLGGEGFAALGVFALRVGYAEGTLRTQSSQVPRDYVEGVLLLGVRPLPGLEVAAGPYARATGADSTLERLLLWRLRLRFEAPIGGPHVRGYLEVGAGVVQRPATPDGSPSWRGGAVGILIRPRGGPLNLRLEYAMDDTRGLDGTGPDTVEGLTVTVGLGGS